MTQTNTDTDTNTQLEAGLTQAYEGAIAGAQCLYERASALADEFWVEHHRAREERPKHEWGFIGVRARLREGSVQIEWFRARYWQQRKASRGSDKKSPALEYLSRGRTLRYTPGVFRRVRAKVWEIELAMKFEDEFEVIRRQSQLLGKIRRYVIETRKAGARHQQPLDDSAKCGESTAHPPQEPINEHT